MTARVLLSWSSGKDSAGALHRLRKSHDTEIVGLLTTFNEAAARVAMHAVRQTLVEAQAAATGLPLWPVALPYPCSNEQYAAIMGSVVAAELERAPVIEWIKRTAARAELTASVCTGAFLLGKAGLLGGKTITTHWEDLDDFRTMFPDVSVQGDRRWIDSGDIITSAGISAGLDMSLHLVERLESEELAVRTARQMDYEWQRATS